MECRRTVSLDDKETGENMAKLKIRRLGAVRDYELDVKHVNVLIGEQATGKSTICKIIYFFRMVKNEITEYLFRVSTSGRAADGEKFPKALNAVTKDIFVQLFGYSWELPDDLYAEYFFTDEIFISVYISIVHGKRYLEVRFSDELIKKVKGLERSAFEFYGKQTDDLSFSYISSERVRLHNDLQWQINAFFQDELETYYIPAGRSMLTLMTHQKTKLDYTALDLANRKFMQFIESIQPKFDRGISMVHNYYVKSERRFSTDTMIKELKENLKGEYFYNDGQEYFMVSDHYKIPINFISSGQQEVLWLLNQLYVLLLREERAFVIIEEPEAHLYPKLQKRVIDFIVRFANLTGSTVLITTHSPYILSCINTLCYAGKLAEDETKREQVAKIVGKHTLIKPGEIYAGKLLCESGRTNVQNLVMEEEQELYTELIDEVSDMNNELYTRLYELEV